jgi:hypothetical protein
MLLVDPDAMKTADHSVHIEDDGMDEAAGAEDADEFAAGQSGLERD